MKKITFFLSVFLSCICLYAQEKTQLTFKYFKGDKYRILSTVNEDIFFNGVKSHSSTIINRVTGEVTETFEDGSGILDCIFMTSENSTGSKSGRIFTYGEEYKSIFKRSKTGIYEIDDIYFMPTVRDVPVFPDYPVKPGDTWQAKGHEAHDLRRGFNIEKPYKVPFTADYIFKEIDQKTGLYVISAKYTMTMKSPPNNSYDFEECPVFTKGYSDEIIYWDNEKGAIDHYTESFKISIKTDRGNIFEFTGTAKAEVTDFERISTKENLETVQKAVEDLGLDNVSVTQGEKGLTISLEDIKFMADSAELLESEKLKLHHIGEILQRWPSNDLLISGHTALAGTKKLRQILSEERAAAVADYLIELGIRDKYHIFTQGWGAEKPIAPNTDETGKAKNRRVEITILDQ